jgi:hypothetical protein
VAQCVGHDLDADFSSLGWIHSDFFFHHWLLGGSGHHGLALDRLSDSAHLDTCGLKVETACDFACSDCWMLDDVLVFSLIVVDTGSDRERKIPSTYLRHLFTETTKATESTYNSRLESPKYQHITSRGDFLISYD